MVTALSMAEKLGARITVVHVHEMQSFMGPEIPGAGALMTEPLRLSMAKEAADTTARIQRFLAGITNQEISGLEIVEHYGEPSSVIIEQAAARGADLIIMGTHGRTGLKHWLLGSVAERVLRGAPCPVLTTRLKAEREAA